MYLIGASRQERVEEGYAFEATKINTFVSSQLINRLLRAWHIGMNDIYILVEKERCKNGNLVVMEDMSRGRGLGGEHESIMVIIVW